MRTGLLTIFMNLGKNLNLDLLVKEGKDYKWKSCICSNCNIVMWGHGFVSRYFAGIEAVVYLKRYRCSYCHKVVTVRPAGYWPWIRSSIASIYTSLLSRLRDRKWSSEATRQRGGHWLVRFTGHAIMEQQSDLIKFLIYSFKKGLRFLP
jgi:hypothetical protein